MKPALTAEAWAAFLDPKRIHGDRVEGRTLFVGSDCCGEPYAEDVELDAHEVSAKCLHGQEFGFTWEDVRSLRTIQRGHEREASNCGDAFMSAKPAFLAVAAWAESLADRIEALLPPEAK